MVIKTYICIEPCRTHFEICICIKMYICIEIEICTEVETYICIETCSAEIIENMHLKVKDSAS